MHAMRPVVYVLDDDPGVREAVSSLIRSADLAAETFETARVLLAACRTRPPSCLVIDVRLPEMSGLDVQQELRRMNVDVPIVFLTAYADVPTSVRAMKSGALEFLTKPFDGEALLNAVQEGVVRGRTPPRKEAPGRQASHELVGRSASFEAVSRRAAAVAPTDATVLILGETGTGKELLARSIHAGSRRASKPFVCVNCGAIQPSLVASELFGHEKGAFTGALQRRPGRFELADGGTIFLDEVGELPPEAQVALLRVLQEREFERVGGNQTLRLDVRVIAATNRDLGAATASGAFRSDLFFRLNVFPISVPPLRERKEDIRPLVEHFLRTRARRVGGPARAIDRGAMELLERYTWPGNVRELQSVLERWAIISDAGAAATDELPRVPDPEPAPSAPPLRDPVTFREHVEVVERALIGRVLAAAGGNHSEAARRLGMSRGALLARIRKYGTQGGRSGPAPGAPRGRRAAVEDAAGTPGTDRRRSARANEPTEDVDAR